MVAANVHSSVSQHSNSHSMSYSSPSSLEGSMPSSKTMDLSGVLRAPRVAWNNVRHAGLVISPRISRVAASMRHQVGRGTEFTLSSIERVFSLSEARALKNRALVGFGFLSLAQLARWATVPAYIIALATSPTSFSGLSLVGALGVGAFVSSSIGMNLMRSVAVRTLAQPPDLKKEIHIESSVDQQKFFQAITVRQSRIEWMVRVGEAMDSAKQKYIRMEGKVFSSNQLLTVAFDDTCNIKADLIDHYASINNLDPDKFKKIYDKFNELYKVLRQEMASLDGDINQKILSALEEDAFFKDLPSKQKEKLISDLLRLNISTVKLDARLKVIADKIRKQLANKASSVWWQKLYNWHFKSLDTLYASHVNNLLDPRNTIPFISRTRADGTEEKGVLEYFDSQAYSTDQTKKTRVMIIESIAVRPRQAAVDYIDLLKWRDQTEEKLIGQDDNTVVSQGARDILGQLTDQEKKALSNRGIDISQAEKINQMTNEALILAAFDGLTHRQKVELQKAMPLDDRALKVERAIRRHVQLHPTQFDLYAKATPALNGIENLEEVDINACVDCIREKREQKTGAYLKVYVEVFQKNDEQFSEFISLINKNADHEACSAFFDKYGLDPKSTEEQILACFAGLLASEHV